MTNKEKKCFILDAHKLLAKYRPYDKNISSKEMILRENSLWRDFLMSYFHFIPKTFYKFRKPNDYSLENFKNNQVWFCYPEKFDDTLDSAINNDLEEEIKGFEKQRDQIAKKLALAFARLFSKSLGIPIDESLVDEIYPLFKKDGTCSEKDTEDYLMTKSIEKPVEKARLLQEMIRNLNGGEALFEHLKLISEWYIDLNDTIKSKAVSLSLTETDNPAMWTYLADESRGFCIEYEITSDTLLGKRMLMNLLPIYYGKKHQCDFLMF